MMQQALGIALPVATATLLAYVCAITSKRPASEEARLSRDAFSLWWFATALVTLLGAFPTLFVTVGVRDPFVHRTLVYANALPLAVGLASLQYYVIYIYTGRRAALLPIGLAYVGFLALTLYYFAAFGEYRVESTAWNARAVGDAVPPTWLSVAFGLALAGPVLAGLVAYASLGFRHVGAEQRYRVALVSAAFAVWFLPVLAGIALGYAAAPWFPLLHEVPGLLAAGLIVLANRPPAFVRGLATGDSRAEA